MACRTELLNVVRSRDVADESRAHLQRQLRSREADCNRMAVQIRVRFSPSDPILASTLPYVAETRKFTCIH